MTIGRNTCSYLLIILLILLISLSLLISAEIVDYPSSVDFPNSWRNIPSSDLSFWETAGVRPILVNGMFVCGFHCSFVGDSCLFAVSIFNTSSYDNASFSPQVVWSANRNNPVGLGAIVQLTRDGRLVLQDDNGSEAWSADTVGKSVSRLNLTAEGNLMLFDKTNNMAWQSFDHPTDSLVLGQRLVTGQKLKASVSTSNSSNGLYEFAIIDGRFTAYMEEDTSQIYYEGHDLAEKMYAGKSFAEFRSGRFGDFYVELSANFIRLGSDGHLLDLGCSAILPTSCDLSEHQSLLELQGVSYVAYPTSSNPTDGITMFDNGTYVITSSNETYVKSIEDCKQACLKNCSCKAAIFSDDSWNCYLPSEVFSFRMTVFNFNRSSMSTFIKVQKNPIAENSNKNPSLPNPPKRRIEDIAVFLGSTLGAIFGVFLICIFLFLRIKKGFKKVEEDYLDNISGMPARFYYEELKNVTQNFSNKLGEGGFGSVFHGTLPSGSEVAVKHLDGFGPVKKSFIAEVQTIGSIHHFNLVSLVGFCAEKFSGLLVYEYMPNGSLDRWIFNKNQELALGWQIRKKIILDIAKGLAYLHEECNQKIIHLDIKPQNILLDENFNAKVSDFGLSKLIGRDQSQVITTMRGTPGYMVPEWLSSVISEKADVYSFGIVVLEILCGRKNVDGSQQEEDRHLLGVFRRKQEEGQLLDLVDNCSDDMQSNAAEVVEMMKVAAWCLQTEYSRRPSMSTVVKVFEGSVDVAGNLKDNFLNELTPEALRTFASTVSPSTLSGPR